MIYIIMGVSGSGKTTIGKQLSSRLNCPFYDADDFHPPENIEKMRQSIPLTDQDRYPWLISLKSLIHQLQTQNQDAIIACSALKKSYRNLLKTSDINLIWIYLKGSFEEILERLENREQHFMKSEMLQSQFDALEDPNDAIIIDISLPPAEIVDQIILALS